MDFLGGYSNAQILLAYFISGIGQSGTAGKVERSVDFFENYKRYLGHYFSNDPEWSALRLGFCSYFFF